ncbi:translation initiation factor IF-2-like [Cervus elaphus]|uniref:translation initiation factor IF-2-like n=1 Tax=Cervus elaphus TaxID=9860 RepID=UPI001CC2BB63|nr:translation initiation factor IF-2-like [Cervus elaphus]
MARSDAALDALPPARQRAFEAYLCGTVSPGAENTRRGRNGRGPGGESRNVSSQPRQEDTGGKLRPRRRARTGSGYRAVPGGGDGWGGGPRAPGRAEPGSGTRHPRGRACAALPLRPGRGGLAGASSPLGKRGGGGGRPGKPEPEPARSGLGGAAAAEVGVARGGGKSRRSGAGCEARGARRLRSRIAHVCGGPRCRASRAGEKFPVGSRSQRPP